MGATADTRPSRAAPRRKSIPSDEPLPDILRALGDEHKYQARLLNLLEKQVGLLNQRQQPDYEVMHGVMRYMTQYPDRFHHPKEDLLFEKIVLRDPASKPKVDELLQAHQTIIARGAELMALIDRHRDGARGTDPNLLRKTTHAYIGALRRHMDIEWLHLFPRAQQVLQSEDWSDVDRRMKPILDPVFGEQVGGEFENLREAEAIRPEAAGPGRLGAGLIEAAALIESVTALIAGTSRMRRDLAQHNRETLRINRELMGHWLETLPLDERLDLVRETCRRNLAMVSEINSRMLDLWTEVWNGVLRPYEESETPYAPKLAQWRHKGRRASARAKAATRPQGL